MNSLKVIDFIIENTNLINEDLKWCFVNKDKIPFNKSGYTARPNNVDDFSDLGELVNPLATSFVGVGILINATPFLYAVDIDKCIAEPFNIQTLNEHAKKIINFFPNHYTEISFSGTGIRILFKREQYFNNYKDKYYIKKSDINVEFYGKEITSRYVTITGRCISSTLNINLVDENKLIEFLDTYMLRNNKSIDKINLGENITDEMELKFRLKKLLVQNGDILELWSSQAPGFGKNESELDYVLLRAIVTQVTSNYELAKVMFERSPYFKSKDKQHLYKWEKTNYYDRTYKNIVKGT